MTFSITFNQLMTATFEVKDANSLEDAILKIYKMEVKPIETSARFSEGEWFQNFVKVTDDETIMTQRKIPQEIVERAGVPWK